MNLVLKTPPAIEPLGVQEIKTYLRLDDVTDTVEDDYLSAIITAAREWYEAVQEVIEIHKPEIIVVNGGDNQFLIGGSLVMGKNDIYQVYKAAPNAKIISVHMEAVNHWTLSREELKSFIKEKGLASHVFVPNDGESYTF